MSDTPDFDSMSPEEMMKWMESLAVRQGASEGLTTSADMAIDEVDENDERLEGMGEYKPYGMSDEDWAKMQEREEAEKAEKAARLAAQPPAPEPEPIAEPVAEAQPSATDDGTPDFDSMSPEEMMEWMESLAKRQGADEGFTTTASMQVAEVDENDERLEGMGEYKPYGMSDEDWAKMQEREEAEKAEKAARLAAQQQDSAPPPPAPEPEPIAEPVAVAQPSATDDGTPDFDSMSPEEMMEWMESLAKRQGADEGFTTTASMQVAEVDENDERLEGMGEYKPYGMSDEDWAKMQEREEAEKAEKVARLAAQQADAIVEEEYTYEDDEDYVEYDDDEEYFESSEDSEDLVAAMFALDDTQEDDSLPNFEDILPADDPVAESENPMDWLNSLSGGDEVEEAPDLDFSLEGLGDLAGLGETEATGDPMDWLNSLSGGDDNAIDLSALTEDSDEGSLEWMESLASDEGADSEELITAAGLDIPRPDAVQDDGPGYEEFSFEEATGMVNDTETIPPVTQPEMDLENPEGWLDSLATGVASNDLPDDFFDGGGNEIPIPDDFFDGAENELPDDLFDGIELEAEEEGEFDSHADKVKAQMDSGKLGDSPEDINAFFASAFAKAAERTDVPDYIDMEDDEEVDIDDVEMPVQAEIPAWLEESMSTAPQAEVEEEEPTKKTATAEMMIADLGLEDEVEESDIPEWLQTGSEEDTGAIDADIFAPEIVEEAEAQFTMLDATDTQDTWVDAFSKEDSREMKQWYENAVANLDGDEVAAQAFEAETEPLAVIDDFAGLEVADLPIESKLAEGSPQNVPDWMSDKREQSVEVEPVQNDMSWLDETADDVVAEADDADMPDWLQETVDDSVTEGEDLPDWLAGETDISQDEIPDWLRETMDEEEVSVADIEPLLEEVAAQAPVAPVSAPLPVPVAQSPAPIQAVDEKIDAVAYLRSAKEKISARDIDGAMLDYEQVIRANKALPQVEKELQRLTDDKSYKKNPSINRVLGDVLMRQGKLQEALDTYRKALNML